MIGRLPQLMRTKGILYLAAIALALGLLVAGCGGGGDNGGTSSGSSSSSSSSSGGETLTKDEFIGKANAICNDGRSKLTQIQTDLQSKLQGNPGNAQSAIADSVNQLVPVLRQIVDQIGALNAPADLQSKLDEFKTKSNEALDTVAKDPTSAASNTSAFSDLNDLAKELGLTDCGATSG
jgi:hypothetical protein